MDVNYAELKSLRKYLHQHPELSGKENRTAERIKQELHKLQPNKVLEELGGSPSFAAVFDSKIDGPTIAFRCELDALPIHESTEITYRSIHPGISHKCGHDGHMTILVGMAKWLSINELKRGRIILLFQSAEETGAGAKKVVEDQRFIDLNIDYMFALHNLPGEKENDVLIFKSKFSSEVISFHLEILGVESHASEPEKGNNPTLACTQIIQELQNLNDSNMSLDTFAQITPVHTLIGTKSYGISPGKADLHYTVRTFDGKVLNELREKIEWTIDNICQDSELSYKVKWIEYFPETVNDNDCLLYLKSAANSLKLNVKEVELPNRFGEDFGWYSKDYRTAMFGLGAGGNSLPLHNPHYDFNDENIKCGVRLFCEIIKSIIMED